MVDEVSVLVGDDEEINERTEEEEEKRNCEEEVVEGGESGSAGDEVGMTAHKLPPYQDNRQDDVSYSKKKIYVWYQVLLDSHQKMKEPQQEVVVDVCVHS